MGISPLSGIGDQADVSRITVGGLFLQKKVFGFDIDGVLTADDDGRQNTWVVEAGRFFKKKPVRASFRLDEALGLKKAEVERFFRAKGHTILAEVPVRTGCVDVLCELKNQGHTVHLITARNEGFRQITEDWLQRHAIPYDSLTMNEAPHTAFGKGKVCRSLSVELFVDDNYENCLDIHRSGVPVLMYYASHNRERHPFVPVVHDWDDIRSHIETIL